MEPILALWVLLASPVETGEPPEGCGDPVFVQFEGRLLERPNPADRLEGYREFLRTYPDSPCAPLVRQRIESLSRSEDRSRQAQTESRWLHRARGGVLDPDQDLLTPWAGNLDPAPRNQLRLSSQIVWLSDRAARQSGLSRPMAGHVLGVDVAPVPNLALTMELPVAGGAGSGQGFGYAMGNLVLGVRGIWGTELGEETALVLTGGVLWGTGWSEWFSRDRDAVLDAMAYAQPLEFGRFRSAQTDYAPHVAASLQLGRHALLVAASVHVLIHGQPVAFDAIPRVDPVDRLIRFDGAWQVRLAGDWVPFVQLGAGLASPESARASYFVITPGAQKLMGRFALALSARIPAWTEGGFGALGVFLDAAMRLW